MGQRKDGSIERKNNVPTRHSNKAELLKICRILKEYSEYLLNAQIEISGHLVYLGGDRRI